MSYNRLLLIVFSWCIFTSYTCSQDNNITVVDSNWIHQINRIELTFHQKVNVLNILELPKNRAPGFFISRPGGNQFDPYSVRVRGVQSFHFYNHSPLVTLDEIPVYTHSLVIPQEVSSVIVENNAGMNAMYGFRSMPGTIHYHSDSSLSNEFQVEYSNTIGIINTGKLNSVLSPSEFLKYGGNDLGHENDFLEEVLRRGYQIQQRLTTSKKWKNTLLQLSGQHYHLIPTLENTLSKGFRSRMLLRQHFWKKKIEISYKNYLHWNNSSYGEPQAYFYATLFNPTSPVKNENLPQFGGYHEEIQFNYFNPVSILDQISSIGENKSSLHHFSGKLYLLNQLYLKAHLSRENSSNESIRKAPATSFFRGYSQMGEIINQQSDLENNWLDLSLNSIFKKHSFQFIWSAGYNFQDYRTMNELIRSTSFDIPVNSADLDDGKNLTRQRIASVHRLQQIYLNSEIKYRNLVRLNTTFSENRSSRLGKNTQPAWLYGIYSTLNLQEILSTKKENLSNISVSYGKNGNPPYADNLANSVLISGDKFFYNGNYIDQVLYAHDRNPDLSWEEKREWEISYQQGFRKNRWILEIARYFGISDNLIERIMVPSGLTVSGYQYQNPNSIRNRGWETNLKGNIIKNNFFIWNIEWNIFRFFSKLQDFPPVIRDIGGRCGCGSINAPFYLDRGKEIGIIKVFEAEYINDSYREVDRNSDGIIDIRDMFIAGNSMPDWFFGMTNALQYKKWDIFVKLRGAFGHLVTNEFRLHYELKSNLAYQNILKTKYFDDRSLYRNIYTKSFTEKANYLTLDQFLISFDLSNIAHSFSKEFRIMAGAENIWTITGYTGMDPEVRVQDIQYSENGKPLDIDNLNSRSLASGIENIYTLPVNRSWYFGIKVIF